MGKQPREIFAGKDFKVLEISEATEEHHYLVVSPEENLSEGMKILEDKEGLLGKLKKVISGINTT